MLQKTLKELPFYEQVYRKIKDDIISQKLQGGDVIYINRIASSFNTSRTPVRRAFHKLEKEGWIDAITYKGAIVVDPDVNDIEEICHIRLFIERLAIKQAIRKRVDSDISKLMDILSQMEDCAANNILYLFVHYDFRFHFTLVEISKSKMLSKLMCNIEDDFKRIALRGYKSQDIMNDILLDYKYLVNAIVQQELVKALELLLKSITKIKKHAC